MPGQRTFKCNVTQLFKPRSLACLQLEAHEKGHKSTLSAFHSEELAIDGLHQ